MANLKSSWRERRWKLFELSLQANPKLLLALKHLFADKNKLDRNYLIGELFPMYGIPTECRAAVELYAHDQNLDRERYMKEIVPPFFFWSTARNLYGPSEYYGSEEDVSEFILSSKSTDVTKFKISSQELKDIVRLIAGPFTVVQLYPFLTKSELHELIDEFWDELEPTISQRPELGKLFLGSKLTRKIQPSKPGGLLKRNELIMKLSDSGISDLDIAGEVHRAGFGSLTESHIRQIRYRLKNKK
jgi:hypothetical protein